jgi:DNA modification methylase
MVGHRAHQVRLPGLDSGAPCPEDERVHDWFRFVLGFPPSLVRDYLQRLDLGRGSVVLDPFAGTGTTLVECRKNAVACVGVEANPLAHFAARVKLDWTPSPRGLLRHAERVAEQVLRDLPDDPSAAEPLRTLPAQTARLLITDSISAWPLHKTLVLLEALERDRDDRFHAHELLALARVLPTGIGNLRFGPEVGLGQRKLDSPVVGLWLDQVRRIVDDLDTVAGYTPAAAEVHLGDAREVGGAVASGSIDGVITSPPYPNEKDYTRTVRLESVLLGFIQTQADLRAVKRGLLRSNTRGVYKGDEDDVFIRDLSAVGRIADAIEARRLELGKNSGFERLYPRVTRLYFGGMARHLAHLRDVLKPGARLAYVVGDQASYLRVMIRTGQLLGEIAESLGYRVLGIDLFRTRMATATKEHLREEVLLLRWPGTGGGSTP